VLSVPPMINMKIFVPWDLTFGTGFQTVGALVAALTVGWALKRSAALAELGTGREPPWLRPLYLWIRFVIPAAIVSVGVWWLLTEVLGVIGA
jgi:SNF family Na+-dependent transporter